MTTVLIVLAVLVLLLIFFVCPTLRKHSDRELMVDKFVAHRGLHTVTGAPENSLAAFKEAMERGFIIENDIHLTKDGVVVVFHDDDLKRMCGVDGKPEEMTLEELKKLRLLGSEETIPTLKECLQLVDGKVPLLIEFKSPVLTNYKPLCIAANEVLKDYKGKYFMQSFNPLMVYWYRKNRPDIMRGQLASAFYNESFVRKIAGALFFNVLSRPDFVSYEYKYKNNFFRRLTTLLGAFPVAWTYTEKSQIEKTKKSFKTFIFEKFIP
jgi:glycerophosphoryl diester phosphodiesterase